MSKSLTRREFLRRSAPLIAAGVVSTSFAATVARKLFGPKKYWDMGVAHQKAVVRLGMDRSMIGDSTVVTFLDVNGQKYEIVMDYRITDVSFVKDPLPGYRTLCVANAHGELITPEVAQPVG